MCQQHYLRRQRSKRQPFACEVLHYGNLSTEFWARNRHGTGIIYYACHLRSVRQTNGEKFKISVVVPKDPRQVTQADFYCRLYVCMDTLRWLWFSHLPLSFYSITLLPKTSHVFPPGFGPRTFRVLGKRDNHYTTETHNKDYWLSGRRLLILGNH